MREKPRFQPTFKFPKLCEANFHFDYCGGDEDNPIQSGGASMKMFDRQTFSRRSLLRGATASLAAVGLGALGKTANATTRKKSETGDQSSDGEILGQGDFR